MCAFLTLSFPQTVILGFYVHTERVYNVCLTLNDTRSSADSLDQKGEDIIFQLGVLILELVTGQSSVQGSTDLIQWIQGSRLSASIQKMIDPDLGNNYDSRELKNMLAVAKLCIKSREKPKFSNPQIFRYLQKKLDTH